MKKEREKFLIKEKLIEIHKRDAWMCQISGCYSPSTEIAHRIAKSKSNHTSAGLFVLTNYGIDLDSRIIIHHRYNLIAVCGKSGHNSHFNVGFNREQTELIIIQIISDLDNQGFISLEKKEVNIKYAEFLESNL